MIHVLSSWGRIRSPGLLATYDPSKMILRVIRAHDKLRMWNLVMGRFRSSMGIWNKIRDAEWQWGHGMIMENPGEVSMQLSYAFQCWSGSKLQGDAYSRNKKCGARWSYELVFKAT